jgi:glycosyltransferase involved in cell wall biosynthesis
MDSRISIIVPVYNAASTLERCVRALMGQTHKNIEIILVNDGSRDNSLELCQSFAAEDDRIRVIDKPNGGVSSARNAGLDAATGQFIMFCDSDDWAEPQWCEELLSHYEEGCLVMCGHYVEGDQPYLPHEIRAEAGAERYAPGDFYRLKLKNFNAPWNKLYAAGVIASGKLRFLESLTNGEDLLFSLQYLACGIREIVFLDKCVFHYEWPRETSLSRAVPRNYLEQCRLLSSRIPELAQKLGIDEPGHRQLMTDFYNEFQKLQMAVLYGDSLSISQKLNRLREIMSCPEYQRCVTKAGISTNPIYCWLARRKSGFGLWLWHQIRR